jgi:serine/threonine protein kinase
MVHRGAAFLLHQITNCSCNILHNLHTQQNHHVRFLGGTSIICLPLRKTVNGGYVKMNRQLLRWLQKHYIHSKVKPSNILLQQNKLKLGFHCTRHTVGQFFHQEI